MAKKLAIRFDVDTELCLRAGLPRLLELADRLSTRFTFFINPGRAIRRRDILGAWPGKTPVKAERLSTITKMGVLESLRIVMVNPRTLPNHGNVLREAVDQNHEIGLHGGRNHGEWARLASTWSSARLVEEVDYGIRAFQRAHLGVPQLFASPGWNSPSELLPVLAARGFRILADSHGPTGRAKRNAGGLIRAHTSISGEPGGVGYLEHMRANRASDRKIRADFMSRLDAEQGDYACIYDHPFYAGRHEIDLLATLIGEARAAGWGVVPLSEAVRSEPHPQ